MSRRRAARLEEWRYELRVLGPGLFAVPIGVLGGLGGLASWLNLRATNPGFVAQLLTASLEACLPLATAVLLATVAARDPALELLLTVPVSYRVIVLRRFVLLLGWSSITGGVSTLVIQALFPWALPEPPAAAQLIWLAPMLGLGAAGALLALLLRNGAASAAVLGGVWVGQLVFHDYFAFQDWTHPWFLFATIEGLYPLSRSFWVVNRLDLIVIAVGLFLAAWAYLRNVEWRFRGEEA